MSQINNTNSRSILKPIENVLENLSSKNSNNSMTTTRITMPSIENNESFTSSLAFKVIIMLVVILLGILGYNYLEKEINKLVNDIKNYFETKKYTKKEKENQDKIKKQKEIEEENTSKEQSTEDIIKNVQLDIKKNKKEEPVNYNISSSKLNSSPFDENVEEYRKDALEKALNDAAQTGGEVMPDSAETRIQSGKKGWCFIGADNLSRSCAEIGVNDVCMSGEIYPTKDVCINPNLRA